MLALAATWSAPVSAQEIIGTGFLSPPPPMGASTWNVGGDLFVGVGGAGTIEVVDGGMMTSDAGFIGVNSAGSSVELSGVGSRWTALGIVVGGGVGGVGTLDVSSGATVAATFITVAQDATSTGLLALAGTTASRGVLETGYIAAGAGAATFTIDGGILRATGDEANYIQGFTSLSLGAEGLFVDSNGFDIGIETDLDGTGGLTKQGAGALTLTGLNTYTGATTVSAGSLVIDSIGGLSLDSDVTVAAAGRIEVTDGTLAAFRTLSGAGTVDLADTGELSFGIADPTVASTFDGDITGSGVITIDGGWLTLTGTATADTLEVCECGALTVTGDDASLTAAGDVSLGGGTIVEGSLFVEDGASFTTSGLLVLGGSMTVDGIGTTVVVDDDMELGDFAPGAPARLTISGGAAMTSRSFTLIEGSDPAPAAVTVTGAGSSWAVEADLVVGGLFSGGSGALSVADGGAVSVDGDLDIGASVSLGFSPATVAVTGAGTRLDVGGELVLGGTGAGGDLSATMVVDAGGVVSATSTTLAVFSGSAGAIDLLGDASGRGVLETGFVAAGDGSVSLNIDGGVLRAAAEEADYLQGFDSLAIGDRGAFVDTNGFDIGIATELGGNGGLTKQGAGTLSLTGLNTFTGATVVAGGTLRSEASGSLSLDSDVTVAAGARLEIAAGTDAEVRSLTGAGTVALGSDAFFGVGFVDPTVSTTFSGSISGGGILSVDGGSLRLTGVNSVDGLGVCDCGSLTVAGAGASLSASGDFLLGGGAQVFGTLDVLDGAAFSASSLAVFGGMTVDGRGSTATIDGPLALLGFPLATPATLIVSGGATLTTGDFTAVEGLDTVPPAVTVTGAGSSWTAAGDVAIGGDSFGGHAALVVTDGGSVSVEADLSLGASPDLGFDPSTVTVRGAGSSLVVDGDIAVGGVGCGCGDELAGVLTVADGATVSAGTVTVGALGVVEIGGGGAAGTLDTAAIRNDGAIVADFSGASTVAADIDGAGTLTKAGSGTLRLSGNSAYTGATTISGGTLRVDGRLSGSAVTVGAGGTLSGDGTIVRNVVVDAGGTLAGASGTTLRLGALTLAAGAAVDVVLGAPTTRGLFDVAGDLVLDGTLNIASADGYAPGVTRLFDYGGTLTDNGLAIGDVPAGGAVRDFLVQTSVVRQVNLINTDGATLRFWDGGDPADYDNGVVNGGDGVWQAGGRAWTTASGAVNGAMRPMPGFAVFQGAAGTVTVDDAAGAVSATGLQFAVDGYRLDGDALTLAGADGRTTLRVGDGTAAGAGYTVVVAAELTGASRLVKTDLGTAVLTADNTYTGGTTVAAGTLQLGIGGTRGSIVGDVAVDGNLAFNRSDELVFAGDISGSGVVRQIGTGTTILTGAATHTGGTVIDGGTLQVGDGGSRGSLGGDVANDGTLAFNRSDELVFAGDIGGSGVVRQIGAGTTILTGTAAHSGGTIIDGGTLQVGDGGTGGALAGNVVNDGRLTFDRSDALLFDGRISGTGTLRQAGEGTTVLTGASTYTGGTTIVRGGLQIGDGGSRGSIVGDVENGGTLAFARSDRLSLAGTISGHGAVRQLGSGRTVLTGTNTYTGGTTIASGTLQLGIGGTRGSIVGDVAVDGTLAFNRSDELVFAGDIDGSGRLHQIGTGTTVLTGAATHTGGTIIDSGTLQVGDGGSRGSLGGDVVNDGTLAFDRSDDVLFGGVVSGSGEVRQEGGGTLTLSADNTYAGGTVIAAGRLVGTAASFGSGIIRNDASLVIDQTETGTLANVLEGGGRILKRGAGTLEVTADSDWSGTWTVARGRLTVNGDIAGGIFVVEDGGDLGGSGRIGAISVANGGVVAPGNSIGRLRVDGDIELAAGSSYEVEVDAAGRSDLVAATGTATLDGGTVIVQAGTGDYAAQTEYTILTAADGVAGRFDDVDANFAFLDPRLTYDADSVYLTLRRNDVDFAAIGRTRNERATGGGVESTGVGSPLYDAVLGLSKPQAREAFDQLSGEIHASRSTAFVENSRLLREAAIGRLRAALASPGASTAAVAVYTDGTPQAAPATTDRFAVWGQGFGAFGRWDGDGNAATLTSSTGGVLFGADWRMFETWRVGAVAGYGRTTFDDDGRGSSGASDDYHLGVFAGSQWGPLGLRAGAASTWHDVDTDRNVAFTGFSETLHGDANARVAQAFGEVGYGVAAGPVALEPFANLAYVALDSDDFRERGGAAALSAASSRFDVTFSTLGLRAATAWEVGGAIVTARGALGWRHAFGGLTPTSRFSFAGGSPFTIAGVPVAADALVVEAGLDLKLGAAASLGASYSGQFGDNALDQTVRGTFAVKF